MSIVPNEIVALNRTVAAAEVHGVAHALQLVDAIDLPKYHLYHAVRADLLRRIGRTADAASAYRLALDNCDNKRERDFLMRRCQSLTSMPTEHILHTPNCQEERCSTREHDGRGE
jgi:RNA polymerase sigma-70 factor (ECF subfamily)